MDSFYFGRERGGAFIMKKNSVFIAGSLDGFIADRRGGLEWLQSIPNPDHEDMGYAEFMAGVEAVVMGRKTFETVIGFDVPWPYSKPVFVLSASMGELPVSHRGKAALVKGSAVEILERIHGEGYGRLYIDGGQTIGHFLREDLIDEMIITTFPILLGGGVPLFGGLPGELSFELAGTRTFLGQVTQNHYRRRCR